LALVNILDLMTEGPRPNLVALAIKRIESAGNAVQLTGDIPGLFRINDGPELTTRQLLDVASRISPD
jgi:hypothetical protein